MATNYETVTSLLKATCDAIREKEGSTELINHQDIPSRIQNLKSSKQDVLSLVSGLTKYNEAFEINGEQRGNALVSPSDFSDESKVTWSNIDYSSYFSYKINSIEGSENGVGVVITPTSTRTTDYKHIFWFDAASLDSTSSASKTYLIAFRAKASTKPTDYLPQLGVCYYATNTTSGSKWLYYSFVPSTNWEVFYTIVTIPSNNYLKDITMCYCNRGISHYVDWIVAYDITGSNFSNMTFGARATATDDYVFSGRTYYNNGILYTGTMPNNGKVTKSITSQNETYTIPVGYHNGEGVITANINSGALSTPTIGIDTSGNITASSRVSTSGYLSTNNTASNSINPKNLDSDLESSNIKKGVTIFGVTGEYEGGTGYSGSYLQATRNNTQQITFSGLENTDMLGWAVVSWDTVESGTSSYDNIVSLIYSPGSSTSPYNYSYINSNGKVQSALSNSAFSHTISGNSITIKGLGTNRHFSESTRYRFFPFYSGGGLNIDDTWTVSANFQDFTQTYPFEYTENVVIRDHACLGQLQNTNQGVNYSYSLIRFLMNCSNTSKNMKAKVWYEQSTESHYDYAIIGLPEVALTASYEVDSNNSGTTQDQTSGFIEVNLGTGGVGWFDIKFVKDESGSNGTDTFKFDVEYWAE